MKVLVAESCPLSVTPGTVALQAPLSMGFSRQEHWSGLPCPPPGGLPNPGIEPGSPKLQVDSLPSEPLGKLIVCTWGLVIPTTWLWAGRCKHVNLFSGAGAGGGAPPACSSLSGGICALSSTWLLGPARVSCSSKPRQGPRPPEETRGKGGGGGQTGHGLSAIGTGICSILPILPSQWGKVRGEWGWLGDKVAKSSEEAWSLGPSGAEAVGRELGGCRGDRGRVQDAWEHPLSTEGQGAAAGLHWGVGLGGNNPLGTSAGP